MTTPLPLMFLRPSCGPAYRPLSWLSRSHPIAMPLKAKITNSSFKAQVAKMSTASSIPKEQPGDDPHDVIFNTFYGARTIELNRPNKLNSLNGSMARKIILRLLEWQKSQLASVVIIGGAGPKAFCAGGDVAALALNNASGPEGRAASQAYFGLEYQLDHLIATYPKPYIAYMDGITMGGGVGLSVHAPIRIATERTVFAMPETTIGLFPDVGGSFFLPRLEGATGTYLALTSARLTGANTLFAGIATHYLDSTSLPPLTARLAELEFADYTPLPDRLAAISTTINEFNTGLPPNTAIHLAGPLRAAIDRTFSHDTLPAILSALSAESTTAPDPAIRTWARDTLSTLHDRSPTSLKATLHQVRAGRTWSIAETFQREYHLAGAFMQHPDFDAGVRARLLSKPPTQPVWDPASLEQVSDAAVEAMCTPPAGATRLPLLGVEAGGEGYTEYPFQLGLPREEKVEEVVREGGKTVEGVVGRFEGGMEGRAGVREKVLEVLGRRCEVRGDGVVVWRG